MSKETRREFLKKAGTLLASIGAISTLPKTLAFAYKAVNPANQFRGKPNILLITTDTSRCDTLKCMGNPNAISPNLDQLASEGICFDNAHTSSPVCMPARCSLLTGVHTPIHGCIENGVQRRTDLITFPDLLKQQGYTTIMVGKTHFDPVPDSFDVQKVLHGGKKDDTSDFYADHIRKHGYSRASMHPNPIPEDLFMDAFLAETTIKEIDKVVSKKSGPFFAFCSMPSPHSPFDPPGKWTNIYDNHSLPPLNYKLGEFENLPRYLKEHLDLKNPEIYNMEKINEKRRLYYGLAAYCDAQVGRLINYLNESGLRENTLVIFSSDHGSTMQDHGFSNKHTYYDASWRVPLIMSMPGTLPQGQRREFAIWNDITATIVGAAGTSCDYLQGFDLFTPLVRNEASPRQCAVSVHHRQCALATKRWKLIYYYEDDLGRLFDRKNDPDEQNDLYNHADYKEIRNELLVALLSWNSELIDVQKLKENTSGGGRVAKITAQHTKSMKGIDAEQRLNERAKRIDEKS